MSREELDQAMERYADGDQAAFEVLYDGLSPRLQSFLLHQTRNRAKTEDLVQQTFLQIHRSRGQFRPGAPVLPWALAIARRLAVDAGRRARFEPQANPTAMEASPDGEPLPDAVISANQLGGRVRDELAKLPESQRTAFVMIREEGLTLREAAEALGTTVSAVKLRAHRAYEALRVALGDVFDRAEER